jgi:hypothetical protein
MKRLFPSTPPGDEQGHCRLHRPQIVLRGGLMHQSGDGRAVLTT